MLSVNMKNLQLLEMHTPEDDTLDIRVAFPISAEHGAASTAIVYFELEPGNRLGRHTDSQEELLYVVAGQGQAEVAGEWAEVSEGDLVVVPGQFPHQVRNTGDSTLRVVGFFSGSSVVSIFEDSYIPGTDRSVLVTGPNGPEMFSAVQLSPQPEAAVEPQLAEVA